MPRVSRNKVKFLSLEGGGGQGVAYLGAIKALEDLDILPNQITGYSGASAGSITAYLLALGNDSKAIARILSNEKLFKSFYDGPDNDKIRHVCRNSFKIDRPVF